MEKIPDYGDHMSIDDFIDKVNCGWFIDYDGHGRYGTETKMSNEIIFPSDVKKGNIKKEYTHIVWFNK